MRIAFDVSPLSHPRTGVGNYIRGSLAGLVEAAGNEHEVLPFAPTSSQGKRRIPEALSDIPALYEEFNKDLRVTGLGTQVNQTLEKAGRVDDFFQLGMLMCRDALERRESCGGHFRSEFQTEEGEALRDDDNFAHVGAWEWTGDPMAATRHGSGTISACSQSQRRKR